MAASVRMNVTASRPAKFRVELVSLTMATGVVFGADAIFGVGLAIIGEAVGPPVADGWADTFGAGVTGVAGCRVLVTGGWAGAVGLFGRVYP